MGFPIRVFFGKMGFPHPPQAAYPVSLATEDTSLCTPKGFEASYQQKRCLALSMQYGQTLQWPCRNHKLRAVQNVCGVLLFALLLCGWRQLGHFANTSHLSSVLGCGTRVRLDLFRVYGIRGLCVVPVLKSAPPFRKRIVCTAKLCLTGAGFTSFRSGVVLYDTFSRAGRRPDFVLYIPVLCPSGDRSAG